MHTYRPGLALGRSQLLAAFPRAILQTCLPEIDQEWQCFEVRTRLSKVINSKTEEERSSCGLHKIPMASREDTRTIADTLRDRYEWPYLDNTDQLPLQNNDESPGLLESNLQILNRMGRGLDLLVDTSLTVAENLDKRQSMIDDTEPIEIVVATSSHGRAGSMMKRVQNKNLQGSEEWTRIETALGQDAWVLDDAEGAERKHHANAMGARWVSFFKANSSHVRDTSLADSWLDARAAVLREAQTASDPAADSCEQLVCCE